MQQPLAEILRPKTLEQYIGQSHLMGEGAVLRNAIEHNTIHSMLLWGPPGVGKTTLALLIAELTGYNFYMLSAISSGVKDIREIIDKAKNNTTPSILFIDEIHRFSKSQQDSLLGAVEQGIVTLIGATTENPSFEVISPLLSRCQVYILKNLGKEELEKILEIARNYLEHQFNLSIKIIENEALMRISGGDARKLINAIEIVTNGIQPINGIITITNDLVLQIIQKKLAIYDKKGEQHYDVISAFIKSIRGSDPNAAVYWMARMISAGEDPLFIARRMIILASEDIGNANPNALLLANNCFQAVHHIGMPEARIVLSQTAIYLASSPKSNASYLAIDEALAWVEKTGDLPVPLHIRNAPTKLMKDIGYGDGYLYAHNYDNNFANQEFLPNNIAGKKFYEPQNNPRENELRKFLKNLWKDKYRYLILLVVSLFSFVGLFAQDIHYSQFNTSPLNLNPALAGAFDGVFRAGVNQKTQWLSVTVPYLTFSAAIDAPMIKLNRYRCLFGIGINLNCDRSGDSKYTSVNPMLNIAFTKSIDKRNRHKLGIGFNAGIIQKSIDYSALNWDEQYVDGSFDPTASVSETFLNNQFLLFDCGLGAFWSYTPTRNNAYSLGFSVHHLNKPELTIYEYPTAMNIKYLAYFTSRFEIQDNWYLAPMAFAAVQYNFSEICFGSNVEYYLKNNYKTALSIGGGLFYRWADALILSGFINWQNVHLGISYDVNLSSFLAATNARGGFELSLSYLFKKRTIRKSGKEPCPYEVM